MDDFISDKSAAKARLPGIESSASLPDAALWEQKMAAFRGREREGDTPVTVGGDVPATPYGESEAPLGSLWRRAVKKSVRWYIEPLLERQNRVNRALLAKVEALEARVAELEAETEKKS